MHVFNNKRALDSCILDFESVADHKTDEFMGIYYIYRTWIQHIFIFDGFEDSGFVVSELHVPDEPPQFFLKEKK